MGYETAKYDVMYKENNFEIRHYHKHIIALSKEQTLSGSYGFNEIFNYISKNNDRREKIAMTTPVLNDIVDEKAVTTAFVMPSQYSLDSLPKPNSTNTKLVEVDQQYVAVIKFSNNVNVKRIRHQQQLLLTWLKKHKIMAIGQFKLARYNPPFVPGFLKRNEIMIEVDCLSIEGVQ